MSDQDFSPRAARQLRGFGRRRAPDDVEEERARATGPSRPKPTPMAPGSIWGPPSDTAPSSDTAHSADASPPPPPPTDAPAASHPPANPKHRRRAGERPPDPDSVDIHADDNHAWWAQREALEMLVNPKKRGAAARAQRAAREAFAPDGADHYSPNAYAQNEKHNYSWDPSAVYTWADQSQQDTPPSPTGPVHEKTPWDLLGLTSEASWSEVTKRHRVLAKQHHPDRHADQGPDARATAEQRMAEINAAFGDLRKIYRLTDGI